MLRVLLNKVRFFVNYTAYQQFTTLWHTCVDRKQWAYITTYFGALLSATKVAFEPLDDKAIYAIKLKFFQQNLMANSVKGFFMCIIDCSFEREAICPKKYRVGQKSVCIRWP